MRPRAVVVATGSELVRGARQDTNGPYLAAELTRLGIEPARIVVVGDRVEELEDALRAGMEADLCVTSGGLGPTHDDRTVETVARLVGRPLVLDQELASEIEAVSRRYAERQGRPYADFAAGVRKQATLPRGALSLGFVGTAPGFVLTYERGVIVTLPGPPEELRGLWLRAVETAPIRALMAHAPARLHRTLRLYGPSESAVARVLSEVGLEVEGLELTICARDMEIHLDLFIESEEGDRRARELESVLRSRFDRQLFAEEEAGVEELVLDLCRAQQLCLATAESCTGGLLGARLTSVPGASEVYIGGVVSYADGVKEAVLEVAHTAIEQHGAVSAEVACAMAHGVVELLGADVAIAVTGVAGPGGGTPKKPVGLVFLHVLTPLGERARRLELRGDRETIRRRAVVSALHLTRELLAQN